MERAISQLGAYAAALAMSTDESSVVEQSIAFVRRILGAETAELSTDPPVPDDPTSLAVALETGLGFLVARSPAGFTDDERVVLRTLGRILDLRVETLRSLAAAQERGRLLERLTRIQRSISHRAPLDEVLDAITAGAAELLGDTVAALRLVDPTDTDALVLASSFGIREELLAGMERSPLDRGVGGRSIREEGLVVVDDYARSEDAPMFLRDEGLQTAMAAPVHVDGVVAGALTVASHGKKRRYSPMEQAALLALAEHASLALTDAKTVASMREAHEAKDMFLAMVSHELKTPLTVIMGVLKTVEHRDGALDPAQRQRMLNAAYVRGQDLERLIDSLLQGARAELTAARPQRQELAGLVADAVIGFEHLSRLRIEALPQVVIRIDAPAARAVLGSLLENAVSHSPVGSEIVIEGVRDGDTVAICVSNDGELPADLDPEDLFRPFQRGAGARSPGVGLGLHIAARLAESLHGTIRPSSRNGRVTFALHLPIDPDCAQSD